MNSDGLDKSAFFTENRAHARSHASWRSMYISDTS